MKRPFQKLIFLNQRELKLPFVAVGGELQGGIVDSINTVSFLRETIIITGVVEYPDPPFNETDDQTLIDKVWPVGE
jgi:hypothetical protein